MKKIALALMAVLAFAQVSCAQSFSTWRYRSHATDCTAITDGKAQDLCYEIDAQTLYKCQPTAGDCDTAGEWKQVASAGGTTGNLTATSPLSFDVTRQVVGGAAVASIANAAADGATKGAAAFTAADFNATSGVVSIDYTNAQAATSSTKGFLTSTDWTAFNSKQSAFTTSAGLRGILSDESGTGADVFADSPIFTTVMTLPNSAAPTVSSFGQIACDNNYYATGRGVCSVFDGTAITDIVAVQRGTACTTGYVPIADGSFGWACGPMTGGSGSITGTDTYGLFFDGNNNPSGDSGWTYDKATDTHTAGAFATAASNTPRTEYFPTQGTDTKWQVGTNADGGNDNDDPWVLSESATLGTNNRISCAAGGNCTIPSVTLTTVAGAVDASAATSLRVPSASSPTVAAAGAIGVDTTNDQLKYYGASTRVLSPTFSKSFTIIAPVSTDDYPVWRTPYAITITGIHVLTIGGTNVVGGLDEADANGINVVAVDSDITGTAASNVNDDGSLTNPTIASGVYLNWHTTSVSSTPTSVTVTYDYTIDAT